MKHLLFILSVVFLSHVHLSAQNHSAYFHVCTTPENMDNAINTVKETLLNSGFKVIGEYQPGNSGNLAVLCYTSNELENISLSFSNHGALASALKIGFKKDGDAIKISMLNPMYLFYAYLIDGMDKYEKDLGQISANAIKAMKSVGSDFSPFGGTLDKKKLQKYHYKVMMPYFSDTEELNEFASFEQGLKVIQNNLSKGKGDTKKVYELIYPDKKVAVFGIGLNNSESGEARFLPIIGDENVAAMPYELILQGNKASILHGKYRIALHWPELTMGTFMKIMSTPGDIKDTMKEVSSK